MHTFKYFRVVILAALVALLISSIPSTAPAFAQSQILDVGSLLNPDGTINTTTGFSGALDLRGWNTTLAFTSGGHALGFRADAMFAASRDHALRVEFVNANAVSPQANDAVARNDSTRGAPALTRVTYPNLWNGITLAYDAPAGEIARSTYTLAPFADPAQIELRYNAPLIVNDAGELSIAFETGAMRESAPIAWQELGGARVPVQVAFAARGERQVGFVVGAYDRAYSLQIDPTLTWNTFLGGSGDDYGNGIAVDGSGNVYVTGRSTATWGSPVRAYMGSDDAFAAKLDVSGALTWNTFLGGSESDSGSGIAVDSSGNVYVVGRSDATWDSPVRAFSGSTNAFAVKLDSSGALTWNTFLGGGIDIGYGIAVDSSGNVYVAGASTDTWGSPVRAYTDSGDAFAAKLTSAGVLTWNTFLGGSWYDYGIGIAVDSSGNVYVMGVSAATWGSPVRAYSSGGNAFAAKLDSSGALTWNTFLGGGASGYNRGIAVDGSGNVYVTGRSSATWGAGECAGCPIRAYTGSDDAFAAKLDASGALTWNTFLGGSGIDRGYDIAVDGDGNVYVGGLSTATWGSPASVYTGGNDTFAAKLASSGALTWNTFLGGSGNDDVGGIAVDMNGNVYVAGYSAATWGSPVRAYTGGRDAFAVKLGSACALKPAKPTLGLPVKNGSVKKPKVNLKWNDVSCETEYRVTVKNVATNQTVFQSTLGADVTLIKTTRLAKGQTYKWFVQACNEIGCTNSAKWKFSIKP